ncbi:hypothetical protein [Nocardia asteroides]|uniref:hypothetical protein n=1 Tax=Nocardia asteroides TaxID=1824 RepID=UPI0033E0C0AB
MYRVADQRPASGGTAKVAGALAGVGGIAGAVGVVSGVVAMVRSESGVFGWGIAPGWVSVVSALTLVVDIGSTALLLAGSILLFRRRKAGPTLVVLGCVGVFAAFVMSALSVVVQLVDYGLPVGRHLGAVLGQSTFNGLFTLEHEVSWFFSVALLVFPVITFVLAILPSTRRWCGGVVGVRTVPGWVPGAPPYGARPPVGVPPGMGAGPGAQIPPQVARPAMPQPGYGAPQGFPPPNMPQPRPQDGYRP